MSDLLSCGGDRDPAPCAGFVFDTCGTNVTVDLTNASEWVSLDAGCPALCQVCPALLAPDPSPPSSPPSQAHRMPPTLA